jgi:CRP-like cAMP-binding protein
MNKNVKKLRRKERKTTDLLLKLKVKSLGTTFLSKLLIKLTSKIVIPDLYLQILKYEIKNRTNDDIAKTLPRFQTLGPFNDYINYKEDNRTDFSSKIITNLAWVSFYKYKRKLSFIKKANEDRNNFYLILNGSLTKLNLTFKKEKISIEEYLLYMIKMKMLQEKQILFKCNKLNSAYVNLDINNFKVYFLYNKNYNFKELKQRARKELIDAGFNFTNDGRIEMSSVDNYIKLGIFKINERSDVQTRFNLFIGNYVKINNLYKGSYIGDLSKNENNEGYAYICDKNCDICYVNKVESSNSKLYDYILEKYSKIFMKIKNKFYILTDTDDNICSNLVLPLMTFKKFKKGETIITQNSQYEGVYFIIDGKVKISISQTFHELSNTLLSLQYSIFNFKDYVSKIIKTIDIINEFNLKYMLQTQKRNMIDIGNNKINGQIFSTNEYLNYFNGIKTIDLYTLSEGDMLGLNELFDYKTELYNFSAECVSDEVNAFYISKTNFNNIMEKENEIMNNVIQLIDLKAKTLIGKINSFREEYRNAVINTLKRNKTRNHFHRIYTDRNSDTTITKEEISKNNNNLNDNINSIHNNKKKMFIKYNILKEKCNNVKLFKNNDLLNYLKNTKLVRSNSIIDTINLHVNRNIINNRHLGGKVHQSGLIDNFNRSKSTTNKFRKKIMLKYGSFFPNNSGKEYHNILDEKTNNRKRENDIKTNISNIHMNLVNSKSNSEKIIFNRTISPVKDGETLLYAIMNNQKKFDEYKKENFFINNKFLSLKNTINNNILKKLGKYSSFKATSFKRLKIS